MDWILGVSTLLVNANLGWSKGAWWAWALWAVNAGGWQVYVMATDQWGLSVLNIATMGMGIVNAWRVFWRDHGERASDEEPPPDRIGMGM